MAASFRIDGLRDFTAKVQAAAAQKIQPMKRELYQIGEEIMTASKQIVPVRTGYLRSTGHVETEDEPPQFRVVMAYGANYAIYVHENMTARHPKGGQAKFLEIPYREAMGTIAERLAAASQNQ